MYTPHQQQTLEIVTATDCPVSSVKSGTLTGLTHTAASVLGPAQKSTTGICNVDTNAYPPSKPETLG